MHIKRRKDINVLSNIYPYYVLKKNRELYIHKEITLLSKQFPEFKFFLVNNIFSVIDGNLRFILLKITSKTFPKNVLRRNPKWLSLFKNFNYVPKIELKRKNIDVVYAHEYFPSNLSKEIVPIVFDTRFAEDKVIANYGHDCFYTIKTAIWLKKFCIDRSTLVTITTPEDADRLLKHIPEAENKIRVIPMYLPHLEPIYRDAIISKHNEKTIKMLFIGNDAYRKGLDLLLKMFNKYIPWFIKEKIETYIVSNFRDDVQLKKETKKLIRKGLKLKIFSNIGWQDAQKLMQRTHIFIFPTRADTYGLVLIEAMAAGTTIITSNNSPQRWIVNYGKSGLTANYEDIDRFFENLKNLIHDRDYRLQLALNGHKRFLDIFCHEAVGVKLREIFWEATEQQQKEK